MELLFIVGSLRKGSYNRMVADLAMQDLKGKATVRFLDVASIPLLDADNTYPFDENSQIARTAAAQADGIWFFCPEYNGAFSGVLKNTIDILSLSNEKNNFASGTPLRGKPVTYSSAAGRMAGKNAQALLSALLKRLGCKVMDTDVVSIALPASAFSTGEWDPSAEDKDAIAKQAAAFVKFVQETIDQTAKA